MTAHSIVDACTPGHIKTIGLYSAATSDSTSIDMADFQGGVIVLINVLSQTTASGAYQLIDSDDDISFAQVTGLGFTEPVNAATAATRPIFIEPNKTRRYVRVRIVNSGGTTTAGINYVGLTRPNGVPASFGGYAIDTRDI